MHGSRFVKSLQWRHNQCVWNHRHLDCLLNRLFRHRSEKTSKFRITGLCEGNLPVTGRFPLQRASNAESVSIWWRRHELFCCTFMHILQGSSTNIRLPKQPWGIWANERHDSVRYNHYIDVIMGGNASQITSLATVYSTVYSGTDQTIHQSSVSLAFVQGIHRWPVNSPYKGPVKRKMFPFDDVVLEISKSKQSTAKSCAHSVGYTVTRTGEIFSEVSLITRYLLFGKSQPGPINQMVKTLLRCPSPADMLT